MRPFLFLNYPLLFVNFLGLVGVPLPTENLKQSLTLPV